MLDDEDYGYCGLEGVDAPLIRSVEAKTGAVFRPVTLLAAYQIIDHKAEDLERLRQELDDERARRDIVAGLLADCGKSLGAVTLEYQHALAEIDEKDALIHQWRDQAEAALCRVQELEEQLGA